MKQVKNVEIQCPNIQLIQCILSKKLFSIKSFEEGLFKKRIK